LRTALPAPGAIDASEDRWLSPYGLRLRRSELQAHLARFSLRPRAGRRSQPGADPFYEPVVQRDGELQPRRVRGRPTPDRAANQPALRPQHRSELRESAGGGGLLPDLLDDE